MPLKKFDKLDSQRRWQICCTVRLLNMWMKLGTSLVNLAWQVLCGIFSTIHFVKKLFQQRNAVYEVSTTFIMPCLVPELRFHCRVRTTSVCDRHNSSGLGRPAGERCKNSGFLDGLRQLVGDGGQTMHVGVSRCHVTCVCCCHPVLGCRAHVYVCLCLPCIRAQISEICVAHCDNTTGRTARDQTHWRVIHCLVLCAPVCFGSVCLGFNGI